MSPPNWLEDLRSPDINNTKWLEGLVDFVWTAAHTQEEEDFTRDGVYFTTLLWQNNRRQNGHISLTLFSELYKFKVNKVAFLSFRGVDRRNRPLWNPPLNDSEPKAQVRLLKSQRNLKCFKDRYCQKHSSIVRMRTNAAREEAIAHHKVEEYKNKF